jgi:hypothetical protein
MGEGWLIHRALRVKMDAMSYFQRPWARCTESEGLPSSYASSRVSPAAPPRHEAVRHGGALRPVRQSEVIGPGWAQAASTDHPKPTTDGCVRQLQGFDQVLHRWKGYAHCEIGV